MSHSQKLTLVYEGHQHARTSLDLGVFPEKSTREKSSDKQNIQGDIDTEAGERQT